MAIAAKYTINKWAAMGDTPTLIKPGAAKEAAKRYVGLIDMPMPRIIVTIIVNNRAKMSDPWPKAIINEVNFPPIPVSVITPITSPADAQAKATGVKELIEETSALTMQFTVIGYLGFLMIKAIPIIHNTDSKATLEGLNPINSLITSQIKGNTYCIPPINVLENEGKSSFCHPSTAV